MSCVGDPIALFLACSKLSMMSSELGTPTLFGLSDQTVRNWEQGIRSNPEGAARVLLQVIDREPEAVMRALHTREVFEPEGSLKVAERLAKYKALR